MNKIIVLLFLFSLVLLGGCTTNDNDVTKDHERESTKLTNDYGVEHLIRVLNGSNYSDYVNFERKFIPKTVDERKLLEELEYKYIKQKAMKHIKDTEAMGYIFQDSSEIYEMMFHYDGSYDFSEYLLSWPFFDSSLLGYWKVNVDFSEYFKMTSQETSYNLYSFREDEPTDYYYISSGGMYSKGNEYPLYDYFKITLNTNCSMMTCIWDGTQCKNLMKEDCYPRVFGQKSQNQNNYDDCVIKGNISYNNNEKIYHVPGGEFYNATNPEYWFCSEQEAINAGFRKSLR